MREKWLKSGLDQTIFYWYCIFTFVALVFEPLYYFGCSWNGLECPLARTNAVVHYTKEIWLIYCQWDPMFYDVPLWLRVLCSIEVFIFGPCYLITVIGMLNNSDWLVPFTLPFAGALVYSTIVYFAMEMIELLPGTNVGIVFLVNLPWTIIPILLVYQLLRKSNSNSEKEKKKN
jgi:hypothetical protein